MKSSKGVASSYFLKEPSFKENPKNKFKDGFYINGGDEL